MIECNKERSIITKGKKIMAKKKSLTFTIEQIEQADADYGGFCIKCGAEADGVEPDARNYPCDACGENQVFGAGEIAIMGLVR
jgi:hypothetical protein